MNTSYNPDYAKYIDHTVLKADTTRETVKRFCDEARQYRFASVCVNPCHVAYVHEQLEGSGVKTCCVIGFPLGANTTRIKAEEAREAVQNGAEEVDMVSTSARSKTGCTIMSTAIFWLSSRLSIRPQRSRSSLRPAPLRTMKRRPPASLP